MNKAPDVINKMDDHPLETYRRINRWFVGFLCAQAICALAAFYLLEYPLSSGLFLAGAIVWSLILFIFCRRMKNSVQEQLEQLELSQKRLHQSEKLSAIGQLASGVAHEINNPLGVILGFSESSLRRVKPGDVLEVPLQSIQREALRCKNLVHDLLTFSRTSKVETEPLAFNKALEGALSLIMAKSKMTQVTVKTELAADLPVCSGNANQIQQVIINLATNAIDAMTNRGTLTIKTELLKEGPLSWIHLTVSDTGSGIPPAALAHIFEPFYTTKAQGQGTGLGLALVQEIVRKHSGLINVQSRPGHTVFSVKFPVRTGQEGDYVNQRPERQDLSGRNAA
jgi:two-component system, NtrC family, sensor kinase